MSDFYDMVMDGINPNAAGIVERSARESREGGAAAKPQQTHEGGGASAAPVSNPSNLFVASSDVANLSGVMGLPSLNVVATPMVSSNVQPQFSFDRLTPSNGQLAEKISNLSNQTGRAIAADCDATRTHNAQQSTPKIAGSEPIKFSGLNATQLAKLLSENIQTFPTDVWIKEDISGAVVLSGVAPSEFLNFLEITIGVSSGFMRSRILQSLVKIIQADDSLIGVCASWIDVAHNCASTVHKKGPATLTQLDVSPVAKTLNFSTPNASTTGFVSSVKAKAQSPAFLSQIPSRSSLMNDDSLFTQGEVDISSSFGRVSCSSDLGLNSSLLSASGGLNITIRQPSILPKYETLLNIKDAEAVYTWVRKTRKENLIADEADRKPFRNLLEQDAKYEIVRFINKQRKDDPQNLMGLFDEQAPFPKKWKEVTDTLILRILFWLNGPINVDEARERLMKRPFFFPDATTHQIKFEGKLRQFCNDFTQLIQDFEFNWSCWPSGDELTPQMVKDCFAACFQNTETTLGPDGVTSVLKSSNLPVIRTMVKDHKKCTLEEIIEKLVAKFEARDRSIRINKSGYTVNPWKVKDKPKKRQFNQVSGGNGGAFAGKKRPRDDGRPPTNNPRCNNCGSKGHLCSERTCFFWGHPKALGAHGAWPEGTPSLHLENEEFKAWKTVRHETFYSYPENQKKPKPKVQTT